jgi:hypothetical protein
MIRLIRMPLVLACLALAGCPSSSDDDADGGGGGAVQTCPDLCALAPVGSSEADCVGDFVSQANPSVALNAQCAAANDSVGACQSCYDAENVQDSTCAAAHRACFGGGGGAGGAGGVGGGAGGAGGGRWRRGVLVGPVVLAAGPVVLAAAAMSQAAKISALLPRSTTTPPTAWPTTSCLATR